MMKRTNQIFHCLLLLLVLSCNKKQSKQNIEKVYSEKMDEWIFPNQNNYLWFSYKFYDKSGVDFEMKRKIYYFRSDSLHIGTLSASFVDGNMGVSEALLFEKTNHEIYLVKSKISSENGETIHSNSLYFQFPADNDTLRWNYSKNDGIFNCSSFWLLKEGKEKELVVVREGFPNNGSTERFEKDIEYYQKHKGLVKIKMYGSDDKLLMSQNVYERGIDSEAKHIELPLKYN
ncbi:hypothetical protein P2W68_18570 [Chryseobacterium arthrosphaerae]|uniref:hypothetical protein n=1 Tax=Chryseobacterium arthrosphaerae TaxID=651561 RepID=UPI0023E121B7|nr:hypothetical protein [Chryseobacterium arthrosphaerae]WES96839.1 hypothetical protein P2W68_18570 [Chryseobacterium arthrosphaerae]